MAPWGNNFLDLAKEMMKNKDLFQHENNARFVSVNPIEFLNEDLLRHRKKSNDTLYFLIVFSINRLLAYDLQKRLSFVAYVMKGEAIYYGQGHQPNASMDFITRDTLFTLLPYEPSIEYERMLRRVVKQKKFGPDMEGWLDNVNSNSYKITKAAVYHFDKPGEPYNPQVI